MKRKGGRRFWILDFGFENAHSTTFARLESQIAPFPCEGGEKSRVVRALGRPIWIFGYRRATCNSSRSRRLLQRLLSAARSAVLRLAALVRGNGAPVISARTACS